MAEQEAVDQLESSLDGAFGGMAHQVAAYMTMAEPSPSFTIFQVRGGEDPTILNELTTVFRVVAIPTLLLEGDRDEAFLIERRARIVARRDAVVVAWEAARAYPEIPQRVELHPPTPSGVPGAIGGGAAEHLRKRSAAEHVVKFETDWASSGPSYLSQVRGEIEREDGPVGSVAESFLAWVGEKIGQIAQEELPRAIDGWESRLFAAAREPRRDLRDDIRDLAQFSAIVDLVDVAIALAGDPTSHDPPMHFLATDESERIGESLQAANRAIVRVRDRLRTDLSLISALSTSEAVALGQQNQERSDRLQRTVAVLGGIILGPSLVASLFGANVAVPGEGETWGLALMAGLMIASGWVLWLYLGSRLGH